MIIKSKYYYSIVYLSICLVVVFGFVIGYIYTFGKPNKNDFNGVKTIQSIEQIDNKYNINQTFLNSDTIFTKVIYYSICGHTIKYINKLPNEIINLTKDDFKIVYNDWDVVKYDKDEIIIKKEVNDICSEHYIVKEKDGKVAVYYQKPVNGISLKELTNISVSSLIKADQVSLKEGISIYSNQKLAEILEDFSS